MNGVVAEIPFAACWDIPITVCILAAAATAEENVEASRQGRICRNCRSFLYISSDNEAYRPHKAERPECGYVGTHSTECM